MWRRNAGALLWWGLREEEPTDFLDHARVGHAGDAAVSPDVGGDTLEGHDWEGSKCHIVSKGGAMTSADYSTNQGPICEVCTASCGCRGMKCNVHRGFNPVVHT